MGSEPSIETVYRLLTLSTAPPNRDHGTTEGVSNFASGALANMAVSRFPFIVKTSVGLLCALLLGQVSIKENSVIDAV